MINYFIWTLVTAIYIPIFYKLYTVRWDLLDYSHAFFILPISIWLALRKKDTIKVILSKNTNVKNYIGLCLFIFGIVLFAFGSRFDYSLILTFSLIPVLFGLILFLYGKAMARELSFPILYLLLLIPPPMGVIDSLTLPMRYGISDLAERILALAGYPITREGLLLTIGYNDIFMGQPCSGFRSLITLLSLGIVYVYLSKSSPMKKLCLTVSILPLALVGNLIRVMILCLITFYFGEEVGQGFFHNFSGIVMFIITVLGLITIESIMNKYPTSTSK